MNDLMPLYSSFSFPPLLGVPEAPAESYPSSPSLRDGFSERHLLGSPVNSRSQLSTHSIILSGSRNPSFGGCDSTSYQ
jgi:hypothetical protein